MSEDGAQQIDGVKFPPYGYPYLEGVEYLDDYKPGGLHPVIVGDTLDNGRFEVVHKLGHGSYATVWLCFDSVDNKWKAVRIIRADASNADESSELRAAQFFAGCTEQELNDNHLSIPSDNFFICGPNGKHLCNVLPVFGRSLVHFSSDHGHDTALLRRLCLQLAKAMAFLHSKGVCHGDFRPSNILFRLRGVEDVAWDQMSKWIPEVDQYTVTFIPNPRYPRSCLPPNIPRNVYQSAPLEVPKELVTSDIVVTDFGEAYNINYDRVYTCGIPRRYAPPEVMLRSHALGVGADVWALGATFVEMHKGCTGFNGDGIVAYVQRVEDVLGPLPEPYRTTWMKDRDENEPPIPLNEPVSMTKEHLEYLRSDRMGGYEDALDDIIRPKEGFYRQMAKGEDPANFGPHESLPEDSLMVNGWKYVQYQMPEAEADQLLDLLRKIFQWQPEDRLTARAVLAHPWFSAERAEMGNECVEDVAAHAAPKEFPIGSVSRIIRHEEVNRKSLLASALWSVMQCPREAIIELVQSTMPLPLEALANLRQVGLHRR